MAKPGTRVRNALVLYKKSAYQGYFHEFKSAALRRHFRAGDVHLAHFKKSHGVHYGTLAAVRRLLKAHGLPHTVRPRESKAPKVGFDLIVAVGGDGTVLEATKGVRHPLVLGVNSDPHHSVGMFCSADRRTLATRLEAALAGRARIRHLSRLLLVLDGKRLPVQALNDVLVSHKNPAAMSHYVLSLGARREQQRSSGVWISTPAGSTGAAKSAGGKALDLEARYFQYLPRELYDARHYRYRLAGGTVKPGAKLRLRSLMQAGMIYVDGAHRRFPFGYGSTLEISLSPDPVGLITA